VVVGLSEIREILERSLMARRSGKRREAREEGWAHFIGA
jgi:hypothetical protein